MEAITILKRCRARTADIERLETRIQQRRDAMGMHAPTMDPIGGSRGSGDPDKMGRMAADVDALEQKLEERKQEAAVEMASSCALLDMLPDLESKILFAYYVEGTTLYQAARKLKYTEGYGRRKKREAEGLLAMLSEKRVRETLPKWYLEKYEEGGERK